MYQASSQYRAAIANGNPERVLLVFSNATFSNEDVSASTDLSMSEQFMSETDLTIGLCPSTSLQFDLLNDDYHLVNFAFGKFRAYIGVQSDTYASTDFVKSFTENGVSKNYIFIPLGTFIANRPDVVRKKIISVNANDQMILFDVDYPSGRFTFPCTAASLLRQMCNYLGVTCSSYSFMNSGLYLEEEPSQFATSTMREVLGWIAEAACSIARFDRNGQLELVWFNQTSQVYDEHNYTEFSPSWYTVSSINGLHIRNEDSTEELVLGSGSNAYMIQNNPFLRQDDTEEEEVVETEQGQSASKAPRRAAGSSPAQQIYSRLASAPVYHPAAADLFTDPTLQAGDIVTVKSDGTSYTMPVYHLNLRWNGASMVTAESTGNRTREPLPALARRQYQQGSSSYASSKLADKRFKQFETYVEQTDEYLRQRAVQYAEDKAALEGRIAIAETSITQNATKIESIATVTGVRLDEEGNPVLDDNGHYIYDPDERHWNFYSRITQTATQIASLVEKTGVNDLGKEETLYTKISQTSEKIETEAVERKADSAEFRSNFVQTAKGIGLTASITGVKVDADGNIVWKKNAAGEDTDVPEWDDASGAEIWGRLEVTAVMSQLMNAIYSAAGTPIAVGSVTTTPGEVLINAINSKGTGTAKINADNVSIQSTSGSGISIDSQGNVTIVARDIVDTINNNASLIIDADNIALTSGVIIKTINGGSSSASDFVIDADKVRVTGSLTVANLIGSDSTGSYLQFSRIQAGSSVSTPKLVTQAISMSYTPPGQDNPYTYNFSPASIKFSNMKLSKTFLGSEDMELDHAHKMSVDSNGKVTMGEPVQVGDTSANFNIADTQFYKNGISAVDIYSHDIYYVNPSIASYDSTSAPSIGMFEQSGSNWYLYVKSVAELTNDNSDTTTTRFNVTPLYNYAQSSADSSVTLSGGWNDYTAPMPDSRTWTVSNSANSTTLAKTIRLGAGGWANNKRYVYIVDGTTNVARLEVDATSIYEAGYTAGSGSVTQRTVRSITYGTGTTYNTGSGVYTIPLDITYDDGTTSTSSVQIPMSIGNYVAASGTAGTYTITLAGNSERKLTATGAYNAGVNSVSLGTKSITSNGTYTASSSGYDGFSSVTVNVSGSSGSYDGITRTSMTASGPSPQNAVQIWSSGVNTNQRFYNFYVEANGVKHYYYFYVNV